MSPLFLLNGRRRPAIAAIAGIFLSGALLVLLLSAAPVTADESPVRAFRPGEKLTYSISWSNIVQAGKAVMEVKKEKSPAGKDVYRFISTARSAGMVEKFYKVRDTVQSVFDPDDLSSLSYSLNQSHGKKKKQRELVFDHENMTVTLTADGKKDIFSIPPRTQDALSSLYYFRMNEKLETKQPAVINVFDGGKTWSVEVHALGRETIKTPLGSFHTIKVKTYPKYEGVFMHKGEIFMWLTDDERKIPVLMKSTITIGSILATLTEMNAGEELP